MGRKKGKRGKRGLADLALAGSQIANMVPGGAGVGGGLAAVGGLLKAFGIRGQRGAVRRAAKKKIKARKGANMSGKDSNLANLSSVPAFLGAKVPNTYMRSTVAPNRKDGTRIQACEGISLGVPTAATNTFGVNLSAITPLNSNLFPWLSTQAALWTKFYFRKLRAVFITNRNTVTGTENVTVFGAYTPDVQLDAGTSFDTIMNMSQKQMAVQWQSWSFDVNLPEEGSEPYYIDTDGADARLEQQGLLLTGQNGHVGPAGGDTQVFGQLFIEYEIDLYDRKLTTFTMLEQKYGRALRCTRVPEELRRRAGYAFVEEILRAYPSKDKKEEPLVLMLRELQSLPPAGGRASSTPAVTGF